MSTTAPTDIDPGLSTPAWSPGVVASLVLANHVEISEGKLYLAAGGWSAIALDSPAPFGLALMLEVPWNEQPDPVSYAIVVRLLNLDGPAVGVQTPTGEEIVLLERTITVQPGSGPGRQLRIPVAVNSAPLPIPAGRFEWRLWVNGVTAPAWSVDFEVVG